MSVSAVRIIIGVEVSEPGPSPQPCRDTAALHRVASHEPTHRWFALSLPPRRALCVLEVRDAKAASKAASCCWIWLC